MGTLTSTITNITVTKALNTLLHKQIALTVLLPFLLGLYSPSWQQCTGVQSITMQRMLNGALYALVVAT